MESNITIKDIVIDEENKQIYIKETGEILNDKKSIINITQSIKANNKHEINQIKAIEKIFDIDKSDKYTFHWKEKSHFIKIYRTELREYMQNIKLNVNEKAFILSIQIYVEFQTNRIAKPDGTSFSNKELEKLTGLSEKTLKNTLQTLEKKCFIKRIGKRQAREIYVNPHLMCAGNEVLIETVRLFNNYKNHKG